MEKKGYAWPSGGVRKELI